MVTVVRVDIHRGIPRWVEGLGREKGRGVSWCTRFARQCPATGLSASGVPATGVLPGRLLDDQP